jgi:hypothetical protein
MSRVVKKCLLIGINYEGSDFQLNGCINDSENMKEYLIKNKYFSDNDFVLMNDHQSGYLYPTRYNIIKQLRELIKFANKNSNKIVYLFLAYSGHGYRLEDNDGDELDGKDEVLCPIDCNQNGFITDDTLRREFIYKLPRNVKLTILIDACHSGSAMDLKYNYAIDKLNTYTVHGNMPNSKCSIVMISGCKDDQTSSDAYLKDNNRKYEYQGAMTASFLANYKDNITYQDLILRMRYWLKKNKFEQIPQLSSGRHINIKKRFLLSYYN